MSLTFIACAAGLLCDLLWSDPEADIFEQRGIDREQGAVIVVRPDQYVAHVLPLGATDELAAFFAPILRKPEATARR